MQDTSNEELLTLAFNMTFLRRKHCLSKVAMAKLLRVSVRTLNRLEQGDVPHTLGVSILFNLYRHFGICPSAILEQRLQ